MLLRTPAAVLVALALALTAGCGDDGPKGTKGSASELVQAGLLALTQQDQDAAFSAFTEAVKKDSNNHFAHYNLGYILQQRGKNAEALKEYQLALASKPDFVPALYNSGTLYGASQPALAIETYKKVIALDPKYAAAFLNLGLLEAAAGDKAIARTHLTKAITLDKSLASRIPAELFPELQPGQPRTASPSATPSATK